MYPLFTHGIILALLAAFVAVPTQAQEKARSRILLQETFEQPTSTAVLSGDTRILDFAMLEDENSRHVAQLNAATDWNKDGQHSGAVSLTYSGLKGSEGKWFRFEFRGLPARNFKINPGGELAIRIKFLGSDKKMSFDGLVKDLYPAIEADRRDINANGNGFKDGSSVWTSYALDFKLPFNDIDTLVLSVNFTSGSGTEPYGSFFVDDLKLQSIPPQQVQPKVGALVRVESGRLIALGGRWFYHCLPAETITAVPKHYDSSNLDRLAYKTGSLYEFPFAQNKGVWLRKGDLDRLGRLVEEDTWQENPVTVDFDSTSFTIHSIDIPNHPTGKFPQPFGNHSYIQVKDVAARLPIQPMPNPSAKAMAPRNARGALPMGPVGIAVNGVVFYNPFDARMDEAVSLMDRCCGHPDPSNLYHYHKYPVCARSPFEDQGKQHSPLIGWAYDGYPVYGPYEGNEEMAMNSRTNPLNAFNLHQDADRGWHYHVTPGKFPYIIGGFWGVVLPENLRFGPGRGPGGERPLRPFY